MKNNKKMNEKISFLSTTLKVLFSLLLMKVFAIKVDETTLNLFIIMLAAELIITVANKILFKWAVVILETYLLIIMLPFNNIDNLIHFISALTCTILIIIISCVDLNQFFKTI
jgi:hypothetical protein